MVLITLLPWVECRGSVPIAVMLNQSLFSFILIFLSNIIIFPIVFLILELFYDNFLKKFKIVRKTIKSIRKRGKDKIEKYGYVGLTLFVGVPLPFTGVYSGSILAWTLGMDLKKSFFYTSLGALISMSIVFLTSSGIKLVV